MKVKKQSANETLLQELGNKITNIRLNKNLTQIKASAQAGVSKRTLERLESGSSIQLVSFLRILNALELLEALTTILPESSTSPMAQIQLKYPQRRRASKNGKKGTSKLPWTWRDEP